MPTSTENKRKIMHIGRLHDGTYLFLRKESANSFRWWKEIEPTEIDTDVEAKTIEEAIRLANSHWKKEAFRTVICGFRYTLPERDEHGTNALFHHMISSYSTPTGVYHDDELGHACHVQAASDEALRIWKKLKQQNRLE